MVTQLSILARQSLQRAFSVLGLHVQRREDTLSVQRAKKLVEFGVDLVVDGGANRGQYVRELRASGYRGRICSFEPIPAAFEELALANRADPGWCGNQLALGSRTETARFRVAANSVSSSLLDVTSDCIDANASVRAVREIDVEVRRLSELDLGTFTSGMLKLDTQGAELDALLGAEEILPRFSVVECELSLVELYAGQPLFFEVAKHIHARGFRAVWVERGFQSPAREMLQVDALFVRRVHPKLAAGP